MGTTPSGFAAWWREWRLAVALAAVFALPFPHFEFLKSPNELARLYQVRALVDDGTPAVNGPVSRYGEMGDLSRRNGLRFPNKAPGVSFLGAPVYAVLRAVNGGADGVSNEALLWWLRFVLCGLPTALVAVWLRRYAARVSLDRSAATAAVLVWAIGSLAFPYGLLFFSHGPTALLLASAWLVLAWTNEDPGELRRGLAGGLAGLAVCCEYTSAPVAVMLASYAVLRSSRPVPALLSVALGALPFAALLGWYHSVAWGGPFKTGYEFVENTTFAKWHAKGFMGVSVPDPVALVNHLFHPARGLLAWSPALLVAVPGMRAVWNRSMRDAWLVAGVSAFYLFLASAFLYEAWGWMLGPRHLTPWMPFLVVPLACGFASLRESASDDVPTSLLLGGAGGLAAMSIVVTGVGATLWPHVPEEFSAAWAHLLWPLFTGNFRPFLSIELVTGLLPPGVWWVVHLGIVALAVVAFLRVVPRPRFGARAVGAVLGAAAFAAVLAFAHPPMSERERGTVEWIEKNWVPKR